MTISKRQLHMGCGEPLHGSLCWQRIGQVAQSRVGAANKAEQDNKSIISKDMKRK